jgi:hypothetical protein
MIVALHIVVILFMAFSRVINISALTSVMKINRYTLTTLVWRTVFCLTSIEMNGAEISATILAHMAGISTGTALVGPTVIILSLLFTEMVNITVSTLHLLELESTCTTTEPLMKVACLRLSPRMNQAISSVTSLVTPVILI